VPARSQIAVRPASVVANASGCTKRPPLLESLSEGTFLDFHADQERFTSRGLAIHVPFYRKVLSYLQPVSIKQSASDISGYLELLLYHNRFQLLTDRAIYSDGDHYFPAVAVVRHLREFFSAVERVLVLGAGLGSIVRVMHARGYTPRYTLVERDRTVLRWALETLGESDSLKLEPVCRDAESFMAQNERKYDLIFVDVFKGRAVPDFVTAPHFLMQCRDSLSLGGRLALNYIEVDKRTWERVRRVVVGVFPACQLVSKDDNRILISLPCVRTLAEGGRAIRARRPVWRTEKRARCRTRRRTRAKRPRSDEA